MDYTLMSSLEHLALVKIAVTLWNKNDIRALMENFSFRFQGGMNKWREIENKVIEKVSQLSQSGYLREEIISLIQATGLQILKWMTYHCKNSDFYIKLPDNFYWTPLGTVDKKKTAETLIKDESLDISVCYKIACIYCLENDILELWNKMPANCRRTFYSEEDPERVNQQELVVLWTYDIKGEVARMDSIIRRWQHRCTPYQYAFEYAVIGGNKAATEYFLRKLTPREKQESLVRSAGHVIDKRYSSASKTSDLPKEDYADVLCFLLSQIDEQQQTEIFKRYSHAVILCFLDWPWQTLVMQTAKRIWNFISEESYNLLLWLMVDKVKNGFKDWNYQKLFEKFWQQSTNAHKKYVISKFTSGGALLSELFKVKDKENISLILRDIAPVKKKKIIFSFDSMDICKNLLFNNELDLIKFFVSECLASEKMMVKFKEEFEEHLTWCSEDELARNKDKCDKLFQILDDLICGYSKRERVEVGESSQAKRLHSEEF